MSQIMLSVLVLIAFSLQAIAQDMGSSTTAPNGSPITAPVQVAAPAAPVQASAPAAPVQTAEPPTVEKIEVTGSHIKRIDSEGVAPVTTITRKAIEQTGYNSVSDVLRDLSVNSFGSQRESSGSNAAGVADINLRGLGSSNTLVLLNGQRLAADAVTGSVDLNLIPLAAVERVEILKDGASAIYGSDALGGVVNIITRKDFKGNQLSITRSQPQLAGGSRTDMSLLNGFSGENYNVVNVLSYRDNSVIYSKDRSWSNDRPSMIGNPGSYSNVLADGTNGPSHADPNCPPSMIKHTAGGDFCTFNTSDYSTELPALEQFGLMSQGSYDVNSKVKINARVGGTLRRVDWHYAPAPGDFIVPGAQAGTLGPNGGPLPGTTPGQDVDVSYRTSELGNRDNKNQTYSYNANLGTQIELSSAWNLEVNASHNMINTDDDALDGYALIPKLQSLIGSGQFKPFAPPGQKGDISSAQYNPWEHMTSQLSGLEVKSSGELAKYDAGTLGIALGSTMYFEKFTDTFDDQSIAGNVLGGAGSSGGGSRTTESFYTELSIPLIKQVELQLAGRYDHFSDFGDTVNPKVAFLYHATPSILIRGSVGTGFKAPRLQDLYAATSDGYPEFVDAVACKNGDTGACQPAQYHVVSGGNSGLKQETSVSYNAGIMYEPSSDFNIGADWFLSVLKNVVGLDFKDAMIAAANGTNLADYGVIVTRNSSGEIQKIVAPLQNLTSQQVSGVDITAAYKLHRFKLSTDHSQLFYFKEEGFPGAGAHDKLGEEGKPAWRNSTSLAYLISQNQDLTLTGMTIAGSERAVAGAGDLPTYTEYEVSYTYKSKSSGTFNVAVRNLLGSTPPIDDSDPLSQLNTSIYDQVGRQVIAGYKIGF